MTISVSVSSTLNKFSKIKEFRLIRRKKTNKIQFEFNEIIHINHQRKIELDEDIGNYRREKEVKRRHEE